MSNTLINFLSRFYSRAGNTFVINKKNLVFEFKTCGVGERFPNITEDCAFKNNMPRSVVPSTVRAKPRIRFTFPSVDPPPIAQQKRKKKPRTDWLGPQQKRINTKGFHAPEIVSTSVGKNVKMVMKAELGHLDSEPFTRGN
jgi:hypothetical protein